MSTQKTPTGERTGSKAGLCLLCEMRPDWTVTRVGDALVTWACDDHLTYVAADFVDSGHSVLRLDRWIPAV